MSAHPGPVPDRSGLTEMVAAFPRIAQPATTPGIRRRAAVAVTVVRDEEDRLCFLITRRAAGLRAHPGQFALPGGSIDAGETAAQAALRELAEELGVRLGPESVLGPLDDFVTRSGYCITPVVVWGGDEPVELQPDPREVAVAYVVPLTELQQSPNFIRIPESTNPVIQLPMLGTMVHAPTAAVLYQFAELALHRRVTRVDQLEQPVFAWR
jgi:8-oxo-dGTP pyrophosphatase MutT (NUDIX family)